MEKLFKHLKVYTLKNDIIRFEYSPQDHFSCQESLFVAHKEPSYEEIEVKGTSFTFKGFEFSFDEKDPLNTLVVKKGGVIVYKYREIRNSGELPLPNKTPEIFPLMDSSRLLIPESGYIKDNEGFVLEKDVKDLYLLVCEKDYLKLRRQFISLTGKNKLPRLRNFGLFASRDFKHTKKSAIEMIQKYEANGIPLDTFVIDKEWEDPEQPEYTVNEKLFPNIEDFFRFAHKSKIQVLMNNQPLPFSETSTVLDNEEIEHRNSNLIKLYSLGLDGWWYTDNPKGKLRTIDRAISSKSLENYAYFDISKQFNLGFTLDPEVYERGLVMIGGSPDSRSHSYPIQYGAHTKANEQSLRYEIVKMNKLANNMVAHYSSDIGGYTGNPSKNQFIRWFEFGAFSPVLRPSCASTEKKPREPWAYGKDALDICKSYINMRYALLNTFYTASFKNIETGLGVCSPLYLYNPEDKRCYKEEASYMLGNSILVAPVSGAGKPHSLKEKHFENKLRLTIYPNPNFKGPKSYTRIVKSFTDVRKFYAQIKAKFPKVKVFSFRFKGDLKLKSEYQLAIKNAVKSRVFLGNKAIFDDFKSHSQPFTVLEKIKKNKLYKVTLESVQSRRLRECDLIIYKVGKPTAKTKVYLPEGEWFNIFHRNVYQGKRYVKEKYKIDETPVFVKAGSLIPLYKKLGNTSSLSFKTVIYDYYTSKKEDIKDFFYEDDGISTAYHIGEYRINEYRTHFENDRYIIELKGNDKILEDEVKVREVFFKAHIRDNETIEKVLINGEPIKFRRHDHARKAVPFLDPKFARDSKTLSFKFRHVIKDDYKIELVVKAK